MNGADIAIFAVLVVSMVFGLWRGFVREVLSLLAWVAAFWLAWLFGDRVAAVLSTYITRPEAALIAGYVGCFVAAIVVAALVLWGVDKLMDRGGLRGGDRLLGLIFGLARGVLLVTFVVLMLGFTAIPRQAAWWRQSQLLPGFIGAAAWLGSRLPPDVTKYLEIGGKALPAVTNIPISALQQAAAHLPRPGAAGTAGAPAVDATRGGPHGSSSH